MEFDFPNVADFTPLKNNATQKCVYFPPRDLRNFTDLRCTHDSERLLKNPHRGWYWHYIDNGVPRQEYRGEHDPADRLTDFPGLNHLYLRFDWGDVEKEDGVLDWSYIDSIMDEWGRYGYRFAFRICTYEGGADIPFATPKFVYEKGARGYRLPKGQLEPVYDDPVYLYYLERFLNRVGERFDGDPRLETIDVGTFGTWGEGHTSAGTNLIYPASVVKKHLDLHLGAFRKTTLMFNDDMVNDYWERGEKDSMALVRYAVENGMGLDDDGVCVVCYCRGCGYDTLRSPWMFDLFSPHAPITLELEHYRSISPENFKDGFPYLAALRRAKTTFGGFHGYPRPWLQKNPYLTEYGALMLGYRFYLNGVVFNGLKAGRNEMTLYVENGGFAPCYRKFDLKLRLRGDGFERVIPLDADCRKWDSGVESAVKLVFDLPDLPAGGCCVGLGLFEGETPIEFAVKPAYTDGGWVILPL